MKHVHICTVFNRHNCAYSVWGKKHLVESQHWCKGALCPSGSTEQSMCVLVSPCLASLEGRRSNHLRVCKRQKRCGGSIIMQSVGTLQNTQVPLTLREKSGQVEYISLICANKVKIIFSFPWCFIRISKTSVLMDYIGTNLELCDFTIYSNLFGFFSMPFHGRFCRELLFGGKNPIVPLQFWRD